MVRLPVSGAEVTLRAPDGTDDILLQEAPGGPVEVALALVGRLAGNGDWAALTVTDFEVLLMRLRVARFGESLALGFAFFAALIWLLVSWGWLSLANRGAMTWVVLVIVACVLTVGLSWALVQAKVSGQAVVDEVDRR